MVPAVAQGWSLEKAEAPFLKVSPGVTGETVPVEGNAVAGEGTQAFGRQEGDKTFKHSSVGWLRLSRPDALPRAKEQHRRV